MNAKKQSKKNVNPPLIQAVINGDWDTFSELIETADVNEKGKYGSNALIETLYQKANPISAKMRQALLKHPKIKVDQADDFGMTAIGIAIIRDWSIIEELLQAKANPNTFTKVRLSRSYKNHCAADDVWRSITLLSHAVYCDNLPLVQTLLKYGAKIDKIGSLDITPLSMATRCNHVHLMKYLVEEANAHLGILPTNWKSFTSNRKKACPVALRKALKYGNADCVSYLIEKGTHIPQIIYRENQTYASPLTYVLSQPNTPLYAEKYIATARAIMSCTDYDLDFCDSDNRTALSYAVQNNLETLIPLLITPRNINQPDNAQLTPLGHAVLNFAQPKTIQLLLDKGANPNILMPNIINLSDTEIAEESISTIPLIHYALRTNNNILVNQLLQKGVNLLWEDKNGNTILNHISSKQPASLQHKIIYCYFKQKETIQKQPSPLDMAICKKLKERCKND